MAHEDFLLVMPPEWYEVPNATAFVQGTVGDATVRDWIDHELWFPMSDHFREFNIIPIDQAIVAARMVVIGTGDDSVRLWIQTGPDPDYVPPPAPAPAPAP